MLVCFNLGERINEKNNNHNYSILWCIKKAKRILLLKKLNTMYYVDVHQAKPPPSYLEAFETSSNNQEIFTLLRKHVFVPHTNPSVYSRK
jgi:hypothetical protein